MIILRDNHYLNISLKIKLLALKRHNPPEFIQDITEGKAR